MALAHVSTKHGGGTGGSTTATLSATQTHTAGNLLVAVFSGQTAGAAISGIANTAGDTWVQAGSVFNGASNSNYLYIYYVVSTAGHASDQVTVTYASSVLQRHFSVYEFSGQDTSSVFNATASGSNASTGTAMTTSSITLAASEEVIVAIGESDNGTITAGGGGYTVAQPLGAGTFFATGFKIVSASEAAQMTAGGNAKWELFAASFKAASGGGGGGVTYPQLERRGFRGESRGLGVSVNDNRKPLVAVRRPVLVDRFGAPLRRAA